MYHGTPEERAELRRTVKTIPRKHEPLPTKKPVRNRKRRLSRRNRDIDSDEESVIVVESEDDDDAVEITALDEDDTNPTTQMSPFPVVITTYEMIIKDRVHLAKYDWGQVIVDEGHRLKNMDSILMQEIKKYPSAGRMLLTGTPLHVSAVPNVLNEMRFYASPRTTWQSSGLSSTLSCQKSSTTSPPSKNRMTSSFIFRFPSIHRALPQIQDPDTLQRPHRVAQHRSHPQVARDPLPLPSSPSQSGR